jgi:hypothetical protein
MIIRNCYASRDFERHRSKLLITCISSPNISHNRLGRCPPGLICISVQMTIFLFFRSFCCCNTSVLRLKKVSLIGNIIINLVHIWISPRDGLNSFPRSHFAPTSLQKKSDFIRFFLSTEDNVQYYHELASPAVNSVFATHDVWSFAGSNVGVYSHDEIIFLCQSNVLRRPWHKNNCQFHEVCR